MVSIFHNERSVMRSAQQVDRLLSLALHLTWAIGISLPVVLPQMAKPLKTFLMVTGTIAGATATVRSFDSPEREQRHSQMNKADEILLNERLANDMTIANLREDMRLKLELTLGIMEAPPEMQAYLLKRYELEEVALAIGEMQRNQMKTASISGASQAVLTPGLPRVSAPAEDFDIPEDVALIQPSELANINRYPVVMIPGGQGNGKTATIGYIFSQLPGYKVIASPKPLTQKLVDSVDLIFGKNANGEWLNFGKPREMAAFAEHQDLSWYLNQGQKFNGSMLQFLWGARRESMNRQNGRTDDANPWRIFYDEASYTYTSGFSDPKTGKAGQQNEQNCQFFVSGVMKDAFQNFRGQKGQMFIGCQSESVDSIGLKNFAAARDEAWHLYPGLRAIEIAEKFKRHDLAFALRNRLKQGLGVAILEKEGSFEMINLPLLKELEALVDGARAAESTDIWDEQYEDKFGVDPDDELVSKPEVRYDPDEIQAGDGMIPPTDEKLDPMPETDDKLDETPDPDDERDPYNQLMAWAETINGEPTNEQVAAAIRKLLKQEPTEAAIAYVKQHLLKRGSKQ